MARVKINSGTSYLLWDDLWGSDVLANKFPELLSFAKKRHIPFIHGHTQNPLHSLFTLPLSAQAHSQLPLLHQELNEITLNEELDVWAYIWNAETFSVNKAYKQLSGFSHPHPAFKWIWKSACQNKHKVFFWLVLKDRISTSELLRRKNMNLEHYNCVLCSNRVDETLMHLLLQCPFATQCWAWINVQTPSDLEVFQVLQSFRNQVLVPFFSWRS